MIPVKISILIMMNSSCLKILSAIKLKQADNKIEYNQKIAVMKKQENK